MKDGEILEKIERLNKRMIKNKKNKEKDIKKLTDQKEEILIELKLREKNIKGLKKYFTGVIGVGTGLVLASLIALIATFNLFVLNLETFLTLGAVGTGCLLSSICVRKLLKTRQDEINDLKNNLLQIEEKLDKKEHILETLDSRRENWYKRLERELKRSKKKVKNNLPVRDKNIKKNESKKITTTKDEELTK